MLNENSLPKYLWTKAINTVYYIANRVLIGQKKTKPSYELWKNRVPNIGYFKVFCYKCFILNTKENLRKFDLKFNVRIFLRYSLTTKAYRVFNKRTLVVEEYIHITFDEFNSLDQDRGIAHVVGLEIPFEQMNIQD